MATLKTMADRRLQNILSHLSPPVSTTSSAPPQPSRWLASSPTSSISELGHVGERSGNLGAVEDYMFCQETVPQPGKLFEFECRGPNTDREAKLVENLMLSRLHRFYRKGKCNATGSHSEISLVPCRGEPKLQSIAEEHFEVNLDSRELGNMKTPSESEHGTADGLFDAEGELTKTAEAIRSGITSASAVSSSGAASFSEGQSLTKLESKPRGHLTASRVAACEFCDIIQGVTPCFKVCMRALEFLSIWLLMALPLRMQG